MPCRYNKIVSMAYTDERSFLATNLKEARRTRGLTQDDVAALSGVNRAYVSDLENGKRNIGIDCIGRLAAALQVSAASLLLPAASPEGARTRTPVAR